MKKKNIKKSIVLGQTLCNFHDFKLIDSHDYKHQYLNGLHHYEIYECKRCQSKQIYDYRDCQIGLIDFYRKKLKIKKRTDKIKICPICKLMNKKDRLFRYEYKRCIECNSKLLTILQYYKIVSKYLNYSDITDFYINVFKMFIKKDIIDKNQANIYITKIFLNEGRCPLCKKRRTQCKCHNSEYYKWKKTFDLDV